MLRLLSLALVAGLLTATASAHDTWVETNTNIVSTGDAIYVDLKLGNHGNNHRDFKMASKANPADGTWDVIAPDGSKFDLTSVAVDLGYAPKEGFWNAKYVADAPGLYLVSHTRDSIVNHGHPVRSVKSGKTFFVASDGRSQIPGNLSGYDQPQGHALELVPTTNPVAPLGPGKPIGVNLLFHGKPLSDTVVSFIPRRETLKEGFDETYERKTNAQGKATFTPKTGDQYLVVAHLEEPNARGEGYDSTKYSATLLVIVPERCPCCGE
ncbi:DUF4198 domain-containing protein [bacterium]|nr:DUF4198 domain-containing protein [bacterium]